MLKEKSLTVRLITVLLTICFVFSIKTFAQDKLLTILKSELQREITELNKQETPPYFVSLMVTEQHYMGVSASFGTLTGSNTSSRRYLTVFVRVGDYDFDNTHEIRGDRFNQYFSNQRMLINFPLDDNEEAIRSVVWREINQRYRQAAESYAKVKANVAIKVKEEDNSADFSKEPKEENYYEEPLDFEKLAGDKVGWEAKVKKYSEPFLKEKNIYLADASFNCQLFRKYFVTSEGTSIVQNETYSRTFIYSMIKSDDGMELPLYRSFFAFKPNDLPDDQTVLDDVNQMIQKLKDLQTAPVVEPYTGPAILSGSASGVFFHEIFGHRVEGFRLKQSDDAQTFKKKVNQKVLPDDMSVVFDPLMKKFHGTELIGYYKYDDEGVAAQKVSVVESGILKNFLMSRAPIENFSLSNGHGRAMPGMKPVARQSNLIVESKNMLPMADLKNKLIEECKKQGKEFGLFFDDVAGGFTMTGRYIPNAFNVTPLVVYKVYVDGRPDELVRGVDLVGTPLLIFSNISDTGDEYGVFNGYCGAESGSVPVGAASPALLVSQIEVQKKVKSQERAPILTRPDFDKAP